MRVAWLTRSEYMWAHHYHPMVDKDLPGKRPSNVLAVRDGLAHPDLNDAERVTIRAVDEMVNGTGASPETIETLRSLLANDGEVVELVYVVAIWHALTKLMASFRVPLEPEYSAWAPDGRSPE